MTSLNKHNKPAHFFNNFLPIKKQSTPINKKAKVSIKNISPSANINPLPYFPLSRKELSAKNAKTSEIIKDIIPEIFSINENVFFILLVWLLRSKIIQENLFPK
jgi:hypothetical protein